MFCKHDYKILKHYETVPIIDDMRKRFHIDKIKIYGLDHYYLFTKKYVTILVCNNCGKLHKVIVTNS